MKAYAIITAGLLCAFLASPTARFSA